jgi:hypothetical protein
VIDLVDGLYLRQNQGFDFAAWSHVARGIDFSRTRMALLLDGRRSQSGSSKHFL